MKTIREALEALVASNGLPTWQLWRDAEEALLVPDAEPVTQWQKFHPTGTGGKWLNTNEHDARWWFTNSYGWQIRALDVIPQPAAVPEKLTEAELDIIYSAPQTHRYQYARAIEAATHAKMKGQA